MSDRTGIEWTDSTWNPVVGCRKVSEGCRNCYAKQLHDMRHRAHREGKAVLPQYAVPFEHIQLMPERLTRPLRWRKPRRVFVNSVSDLFHKDVPDEFILEVFSVMAQASQHTFQVLTKRPERMRRWFYDYLPEACSGERPAPEWPLPNVWLGTSVENQAAADERIPHLLATPAAVRFLSCEPLLGPVEIAEYLPNPLWNNLPSWKQPELDWIIAGGESGPDARPMHPDWLRRLRDQCSAAGVPFFFKQWGEYGPGQGIVKVAGDDVIGFARVGKKKAGRILDGILHNEYPAGRS